MCIRDSIHIDALLRQHINQRNIAGGLNKHIVKLCATNDQRVFGTEFGKLSTQFSSFSSILASNRQLIDNHNLPSAAFDDSAERNPNCRTFFGK